MPGAAPRFGPRQFLLLLALSLAFRLWLAAVTPITGDEAYFYYWGARPDWGFYDHPPMVGWWLALAQRVHDAEWFLRLPVIVQPALLALGCAWWLRERRPAAVWPLAALVLLAPANVWNVFITTDAPLVYFSFFSALAFLRAARDDDARYYLLAGVLLGGAILSKYFSAFLGLAYLAHGLYRPSRRKSAGIALLCLGAAPALALNAWWNAGHCWANVMFNVYNRHGGAGLSWKTPALYALSLLYLLTPPLLVALWRQRAAAGPLAAQPALRALALVGLLPLALFAALSLVKTVGLHWLLSFLPFVFLLAAWLLRPDTLARIARFAVAFAALHVAAIVAVAALPLETWRASRLYDGIVMTVRAPELLAQLAPYEADYVFATDGYSPSVTLSYNARRYFIVFGEASSHARHDDILTDFRALAGRNILVLRKDAPEASQYAPYFDSVEYRDFELHGARYHLVLGRGFRFEPYRDQVLARVRERYYAVPGFLPQRACYFCERYFPGESCRRAAP